jgi:hypothetical protein
MAGEGMSGLKKQRKRRNQQDQDTVPSTSSHGEGSDIDITRNGADTLSFLHPSSLPPADQHFKISS